MTAQYRNFTSPTSRQERAESGHADSSSDVAKQNWKRLGAVAAHARNDDTSETDGDPGMTAEQLREYRRRKFDAKKEREKHAKTMDLAYFLEMVDTKHRYGSHLRTYHALWKKADTNENFFYWLDYGEGTEVEAPNVSREKLEADQVRYLSREERVNYLVQIDQEGRLCWAKNGERISTSREWRDSVNGIVPRDDTSPTWKHGREIDPESDSSDSASTSSMSAASAAEKEQHYTNDEFKRARGLKKLQKVSAAVILNQLLQKTVKPGTWIYVADTSFRLYVGIKQSGAFQHSSFLRGSRISSAGLIKIKDGQLRRLSPLSGHYRPPTRNFRAFVHSLKDAGVDMSRVSISRSYAVLLGLEGYQKTQKKVKDGEQLLKEGAEWVIHPDQARKREEDRKDKSKSAQREREYLEQQRTKEEEQKRQETFKDKLKRKLKIGSTKDKTKGQGSSAASSTSTDKLQKEGVQSGDMAAVQK